jgi:imidazole glycerol-phosphate synthase subunit HisH
MIAVIDTGMANLASMLAALRRIGLSPETTTAPEVVRDAEKLVLPGVGAFGAGMKRLMELELAEPIRERLRAERPTLAVCLGLQLLCEASEESPGVAGLGVFSGLTVGRFDKAPIVPQLGWNLVKPGDGCRLLQEGYAYFANSYRITEAPPGFCAAEAHHGEPFVAALERGSLLACQFHPELSGAWGQALLARWRDAC